MPSTTDYINQLKTDKQNLVNNLVSKGVEANNEETFTSLVPKVLEVKGAGEENVVIDTSLYPTGNTGNSNTFINSMITKISRIDTSKWTDFRRLFYNLINLEEIPLLDSSNSTNLNETFYNCSKIKTIPQFNTNNVTDLYSTFFGCTSLVTIPQLNTENVTRFYQTFSSCSSLTDVPLINAQKVHTIYYCFSGCKALKNVGGLKDLGKAFNQKSANHYNHKVDFSACTNLTYDSLMNIINNLYDLNVTYGGTLYTQQLVLGSTNMAKLTSSELELATSKGWSVS